ncbi:MAG TPA: antibiotic biosynthesis monooxygenase [Bryobacteraceae bacterium]|jgi:quinol monooxygenase YgiN|nr:antibiotic biosynthesis monooxygenase [Bryobacteraceae bacterium]
MAVTVVVKLEPLAGMHDKLATLMLNVARAVKSEEDGCVDFIVHDEIDGAKVVLIEQYTDHEAFETHLNTDRMKTALPQIQAMLAEPLDVTLVTERSG